MCKSTYENSTPITYCGDTNIQCKQLRFEWDFFCALLSPEPWSPISELSWKGAHRQGAAALNNMCYIVLMHRDSDYFLEICKIGKILPPCIVIWDKETPWHYLFYYQVEREGEPKTIFLKPSKIQIQIFPPFKVNNQVLTWLEFLSIEHQYLSVWHLTKV